MTHNIIKFVLWSLLSTYHQVYSQVPTAFLDCEDNRPFSEKNPVVKCRFADCYESPEQENKMARFMLLGESSNGTEEVLKECVIQGFQSDICVDGLPKDGDGCGCYKHDDGKYRKFFYMYWFILSNASTYVKPKRSLSSDMIDDKIQPGIPFSSLNEIDNEKGQGEAQYTREERSFTNNSSSSKTIRSMVNQGNTTIPQSNVISATNKDNKSVTANGTIETTTPYVKDTFKKYESSTLQCEITCMGYKKETSNTCELLSIPYKDPKFGLGLVVFAFICSILCSFCLMESCVEFLVGKKDQDEKKKEDAESVKSAEGDDTNDTSKLDSDAEPQPSTSKEARSQKVSFAADT